VFFFALRGALMPLVVAAEEGDGVYGRLDGDLAFSIEGGPQIDRNDLGWNAAARVHYLQSVGPVGGIIAQSGAVFGWLGVDLRPLFLARLLLDSLTQHRFWDVLIDSWGIELGSAWIREENKMRAQFLVGTGFELPLLWFEASHQALLLRIQGRYIHGDPYAVAGSEQSELTGSLNLVYRFWVSTGLAAWPSHAVARVGVP